MSYSRFELVTIITHRLQDYTRATWLRLEQCAISALRVLSAGDWKDLVRRHYLATASASYEYDVLAVNIREILSVSGQDGRKLTQKQGFDQWNPGLDSQGTPQKYYLYRKGILYILDKIPSGAENLTLTFILNTKLPSEFGADWLEVMVQLTLSLFFPEGSAERLQAWSLYQQLLKEKLRTEAIDRTFYERTGTTALQKYIKEIQLHVGDDSPLAREKAEASIGSAVARIAEMALWKELIVHKSEVIVKASQWPSDVSSYNIGELLSISDATGNKLTLITNYDQWKVVDSEGGAPVKYYLEARDSAGKAQLCTADVENKKPVQTTLYLTYHKESRDPADLGDSWREPIVELALHFYFPRGSEQSAGALANFKELIAARLLTDVAPRIYYDRTSASYVRDIQVRLKEDDPYARERIENCLAQACREISGKRDWDCLKLEATVQTVKDNTEVTLTIPARTIASAKAEWGWLRAYSKQEFDRWVYNPTATGEPSAYYLLGKDKIHFLEDIPDAVYDIDLTYFKITSEPTDFTDDFRELIIEWTMMLYYPHGSAQRIEAKASVKAMLEDMIPTTERAQDTLDSFLLEPELRARRTSRGTGGM